MKPLISVITVTYNAQDTLGVTLDSIAGQTFSNFELVIIDGASKDRTLKIAREAPIKNKRIFSEPDNGLYYAMNKGRDKARGTYIIFMNAGDAFHSSSTLQHFADAIEKNDYPGVVYGQTDIVDSSRKKIADRHLIAPPELNLESFAEGMVVCHQAFMALKKITPLFNVAYRFSADYEWCLRCLQHSRKNIYIDETVADYLYEGLSTANRRKSLIERFNIMCYYYGVLPTIVRHISFLGRFFRYNKKLKK